MAVSRPFVNIALKGQAVGFYNTRLDRCLNAVMDADNPITIYQPTFPIWLTPNPPKG